MIQLSMRLLLIAVVTQIVSSQLEDVTVQNLRASVFYPINRNTSVISAQITWTKPSDAIIEGYMIRVLCEDVNGSSMIKGSPFMVNSASATCFNLNIWTDSGLLFPLLVGSPNCTVNVRVKNSNVWSVPVSFSTSGSSPLLEVIAVTNSGERTTTVHLLQNSRITSTELPLQNTAVAIDAMSRNVFIAGNCRRRQAVILELSIDELNSSGTMIDCDSSFSDQFEPLGMAYDWLSETLYIVGQVNDDEYAIFRKPMGEEPEETILFRGNFETIQLTINPLTGLFHSVINRNDVVNRLQISRLRSMPDRIDIPGDADIVGIADDVPNGCVVLIRNRARARYIILRRVEIECPGRARSNIFRREERDDVHGIALDESRIYIADSNEVYYQSSQQFDNEKLGVLDEDVQMLLSTSPGMQPLPNDPQCLTFDVDRSDLTINLFNHTINSLTVNWSTSITRNCMSVSLPPLVYQIQVSSPTGPVNGYPLETSKTSHNVTGLTANTLYNVSVECYTRHAPRNRLTRRISLGTASLPSIIPLSSPTSPPQQSSGATVIGAAVGGVMGGVTLSAIVVVVIVLAAVCYFQRKKHVAKFNDNNSTSVNTYNHPPNNSGNYALRDLPRVPALYEEPVQNGSFPNHVVPQEYETALSNVHVYSTLETSSQEAQDYLNVSTYTSLNPLTINREQNTYSSLHHQQAAPAKREEESIQ